MTIKSGSLSDVVGDEIKRYIFPFFLCLTFAITTSNAESCYCWKIYNQHK